MKKFLDAGADVVAICDVDSKVAAAAVDMVKARQKIPLRYFSFSFDLKIAETVPDTLMCPLC